MSETDVPQRGFAIGDIHGCAKALETLLDRMTPSSDDLVVVLGDVVDRGPDSSEVLDILLDLSDFCELIFVLGNHEEMMLNALKGRRFDEWIRHGGKETMESYGNSLRSIPQDHLALMESAARYWEGPNEICVHANLEPGVELRRQRSEWLRWRKLTGQEFRHESGKRVICGHSAIGYGAPSSQDGWICLDTMAYGGGFLSAMELTSGEIFQSRQNGEFRGGVFIHELEV